MNDNMYDIFYNNLNRKFNIIKNDYSIREDDIYKSGLFFDNNQSEELIYLLKSNTKYKYIVLTSSGTASLFIMAIYYKKWFNNIVTTPYTYIATHNAFKRAGYKLIMTNLDKSMLGKFDVNYKDCLYVPVGIFGKQPYIPKNVMIIEDACQHWIHSKTSYNKAISFDPTKNISSNGNGGAILTNDKNLYQFSMNFIRNGINEIGLNLRMTELECAYVIPQFKYLNQWQEKRREIANIYNSVFKEKSLYKGEKDHDIQKYVINTDGLKFNKRIETKKFYINTKLGTNLLGLPIYPELTKDEVYYIVQNGLLKY